MSDSLDAHQAEIHRLIEENAALEDLQQHPGWAVLTRYIQKWLDAHERRLMSGGVDDLLEYKLLSGRMDGVRQILGVPGTVAAALHQASQPPEDWIDETAGEEYAPVTTTRGVESA